ncbi:MAG: bifunctional glutamate N-acetyltransferase/amino-acid acetyltransferase ArgJ, partial [Dehalococcoidales bacterium]|nr:bifunctional glutamate N-acetyltransferase/amino-acid acetyltransferase ArgJ [Dehalococcoidales bacterium]
MKTESDFIPSGGIASPEGFLAGATSAGIKCENRPDLGVLYSEASCAAVAVFTTNKVKAAPVILSRQRLQDGRARAVVINSGCANACTGEQGMKDAVEMAELTARHTGLAAEEVLVASTGVIGTGLPMESIRKDIPEVKLTADGGHELARAIMTTDTVPKEVAVRADGFTVGGMAKGSGMIHPNLATMLCFLTTDAAVDVDFLRTSLKEAVDISLNMVSIDGDDSTNDMVLIMANGKAGSESIVADSRRAEAFQQALNKVCIYLAKAIARDGEGATRLIEVNVSSAASVDDARIAARTIVSSSLVKAAVHGSDPNWGRVIAAAGRSGAELDADKLYLEMGGICLVKDGAPVPYDNDKVVKHLDGDEVCIDLKLNAGNAAATAWGCDLSEEYVTINSEYTT